ncbi:iron hydrogenase [Thermoanaerobacteraceae bacterium SP2]|nr:iron hydrogenase [Thermoanaerobacteraceae bacterium SP2]
MQVVNIDEQNCKGCTLCSQVCKVNACTGEPLIPHFIDTKKCVNCGQCVVTCPARAAKDINCIEEVQKAVEDKNTITVVQGAPAVRVTLGEEFSMDSGSIVPGRMAAALRKLGFDRVYDTCFAADLTIMEEGHELLKRIKDGGPFPMFTSCCPAWVLYMEKNYPDLLGYLSTCKSPQQMFGAVVKSYMAEKEGINPARIYMVSVMPCTAKKYEITRPEMICDGYKNVDAVLTTRDLAELLRKKHIDISQLVEEDFDTPFGEYTGAGVIFGATGGVMEAALRTACEVLDGKPLKKLSFYDVRGISSFREAEVEAGGIKLKVAVVHGLEKIKPLLDSLRGGRLNYHFIEVMTCPEGCIGGGGQPNIPKKSVRDKVIKERMKSIYYYELGLAKRKSNDNPQIKLIYEDFLGKPLGEMSHHLLHTTYGSASTIYGKK